MVEPWSAVVIGFVAGILYLVSSKLLVRLRLDDVVDAIPVHFTNGVWGTLATGLFAQSGMSAKCNGWRANQMLTVLYPSSRLDFSCL